MQLDRRKWTNFRSMHKWDKTKTRPRSELEATSLARQDEKSGLRSANREQLGPSEKDSDTTGLEH